MLNWQDKVYNMKYEKDKEQLLDKRKDLVDSKYGIEKQIDRLYEQLDEVESAIDNINAKIEYIQYREKVEVSEGVEKPVDEDLNKMEKVVDDD